MTGIVPTEKEAIVKQLSLEYKTTADASPWELCQQYQDFLEYTAEHPDASRYRVANNMTEEPVPPGRVRGWLDGGRPDAVRGVQACESRGWLDLAWDDATLHNLTVLIAWIFAGGSINNMWVPYLAATDAQSRERALELYEQLGTAPETVRMDDDSRATEIRPTEAAPPLGRLLSVLGAPTGVKNSNTQLSLPQWLAQASHDLRLAFARTYVWQRGTARSDRSRMPVQLSEERSIGFRRELKNFLNDVAGADVATEAGTVTYLAPAGSALLNHPPVIE